MKPPNTYVISDLHFGHARIAEFRPQFGSEREHREHIAQVWSETVRDKDYVWVLGDAAFNVEGLLTLCSLPGTKYLVRGNHDTLSTRVYMAVFEEIHGLVKLKRKHRVAAWLSHAPIHPDELRGGINLHGHVHNATINDPRYVNVCPEAIGYAPVKINTLIPKKEGAIGGEDGER